MFLQDEIDLSYNQVGVRQVIPCVTLCWIAYMLMPRMLSNIEPTLPLFAHPQVSGAVPAFIGNLVNLSYFKVEVNQVRVPAVLAHHACCRGLHMSRIGWQRCIAKVDQHTKSD